MDYYIVKVTEEGVGLIQPIVAVGDKNNLMKQLEKQFGQNSKIEFSPEKLPFNDMFVPKLPEGIHMFYDLIWKAK